MPFLRFAIVFAFFAFSIARAQLVDFAVLANGISKGTTSPILIETVYGESLTLSVSPATETFEWILSNTVQSTGSSYSPKFSVNNPLPGISIPETYQIRRKEDDLTKTIIITIQSRPIFIVSFDTDGGTPMAIAPQTVMKDSLAKKPTETLTKTGYDFDGWDFDFSTPITKTTIVKAKWKIKVYKVSFDSDGGNPVPATQNINYNYTASTPTPPPTRPGYNFDGWDFDFSTPITKDTTVKSKWNIQKFTVSFDSDGGSPVPAIQDVPYNSKVNPPTPPTKPNYNFGGWDFDFSTPITKDTTIKAKWKIKTYTVSFNSGGGGAVPSQTVNHNATATEPQPTRPGYSFNGWNFDFNTPITKDTTIVAKGWTIIKYTITYDPGGETMIPASPPTSYDVESPSITLPTFNERCGWKFEGWFDNQNFSGTAKTSIPTGSTGDKNFYAKWTPSPITPTINMLSPSLPNNKNYDGSQIAPATVSSTSACPMGAITVLYNDATEPPKNAGTYQVYASISQNENYTAAKIQLGSITISKANVTFSILATVSDKEYDATNIATIKSIYFTPTSTPYGDKLTASDYSASANFENSKVGTHNVILNIKWLNGPLSQNYNLITGTIDPISATIKKATSTILEIEPEDYELSNPPVPHKITINKSPYLSNSDVKIEYKRDGDANYVSIQYPNRIGNWTVRATVDGNENYEGKTDEKRFVVTRSKSTTVGHNIEFDPSGFYLDSAKSGKQRYYYVAGASLCNIKSTEIHIAILERDIYLREGKVGQNMQIESHIDANLLPHYKITFPFGKPGVDTLFYELFSREAMASNYSEQDTILIETPVPFETVVGQKWNNVLFVNNNYQTNGGYKFTDFEWFRNNEKSRISNLQFYSAGPSSKDTLNPIDIYKVVMHTADGIRISTCEGNAIIKEVPVQTPKPTLKKQVLGIKEKSINPSSKAYNLNGKLTKETSAGVYIVEE